MAPIAKENELLSATPESAPRPASTASAPADTVAKPQPVALEVPVSVNGARTVEGSDKREPFSEATKTVLIFGTGAVIRLASSVTPGQLLFLTNEKTKKEVVCQVVKSKNYRNVSGYVELEFTESVVGFWGMRFPGDRLSSPSQPVASSLPAVGSPVAIVPPPAPRPAAPKLDLPATNVAPKIVEQKPAPPTVAVRNPEPKLSESKFVTPPAPITAVPVAPPQPPAPVAQVPATPASLMPDLAVDAPPVKPTFPVSSTFDLPRNPEAPASIFAEPSQASTVVPSVDVASLFESPEPDLPSQAPPPASTATDPASEALKHQTARLQAQLSNMLFMDPPSAKPVQNPPAASIVESVQHADTAAKVLEFAKVEAAPLPARPAEQAKIAPPAAKSMLDEEEMKIPSWLEPLARNAAAPVSTQELIEREKSKRLAEKISVEEIASEAAGAVNDEPLIAVEAPNFGNDLSIDAHEPMLESGSRTSGKGIRIAAIAAGVLTLLGAGVWYFRQPSAAAHSSLQAASKPSPALAVPAETLQPQGSAPVQTSSPAQNSSVLPVGTTSQTKANPASLDPAATTLSPVNNKQIIPNPPKGDSVLEVIVPSQPAASQPKKSTLGEVRLATPKVTQRGNSQAGGQNDAGLDLGSDQPDSTDGALGSGLAANASQPAAPPLPVGGDVKPAKLIASVPPIYPALAKSQHVSGDVRIDALIDNTGHVTTMKIVSGPTLLHQAAMESLRQWKYQPASLDGKPVQMHLTVTVQFRMQ